MFKPYTYVLYHIPTGKKYYGARLVPKNIPELDLWNQYFSSSKKVAEYIDQYGKESFIPEVRKIFETSEDALQWEQKVLNKLRAVERDDWLNQAIFPGMFYQKGPLTEEHKRKIGVAQIGEKNHAYGKVPWNKGIPHSKETKNKIGEKGKGRKHSEETKKQLSESHMGEKNSQFGKDHSMYRHTEETKQKMSEAASNRSPEIRAKMSEGIRRAHAKKKASSINSSIPLEI